jgi:hypothetical protein
VSGQQAHNVQSVAVVRLKDLADRPRGAECHRPSYAAPGLAAGEAQVAAAAAAMRGHKKHVVAGKALNVYRKRVRANKRRLSRR